jgi:hypothetical protein
MAINKQRPKPDAGERFIAQAEGGRPARWQRGNRTQVTLSIAPRLLERLDAAAQKREISRAALIAQWVREKLDQEEREAA